MNIKRLKIDLLPVALTLKSSTKPRKEKHQLICWNPRLEFNLNDNQILFLFNTVLKARGFKYAY